MMAAAGAIARPGRWADPLFVILMVGLSLTGLVSYAHNRGVFYQVNLLPANALFDLFILLYVFAAPATRISPTALFLLVVSTAYILTSLLFLPPSRSGAPTPADAILSFKPFLYLIILSFARPRRAGITLDTLDKIFKYLLLAFLVKYAVAKAVMGIPRPGLFTENNFELTFILVLFVYLSRSQRLGSLLWVLPLIAVVLMSGSRSGLLALAAALITSARQASLRLVMALAVVPLFLLGVLTFLDTRIGELGDLAQVDRFIFMTLFLEELQRFELWNYFVGWAPMTPLTNGTCGRLAYYAPLFSSGNPGICYSVILHVFYFRVFLDHGILGLLFLVSGFYILLRSNGMSQSLSFAILLQGLVNGLSVSGLANTYFALAMVLVISTQARPRPVRQEGNP